MSVEDGFLITTDRYGGVFRDGAHGDARWICIIGYQELVTEEEKQKYDFMPNVVCRGDLVMHESGPFDIDPIARNFCVDPPWWIVWGPLPDIVRDRAYLATT